MSQETPVIPPTETLPLVEITVNNKPVEIRIGKRTVAEIKEAAAVPLEYKVTQVVGNEVRPLDDDASVIITGGEVFLATPKDGGAS